MNYYVAHTRGPDFDKLKDRGFLTLYPGVDDYVFLPDKEKYKFLLAKERELGLLFLRDRNEHLEKITEKELKGFLEKAQGSIEIGTQVEILVGLGRGLRGEVIGNTEDGKLKVKAKGFRETYDLEVSSLEIAVITSN